MVRGWPGRSGEMLRSKFCLRVCFLAVSGRALREKRAESCKVKQLPCSPFTWLLLGNILHFCLLWFSRG